MSAFPYQARWGYMHSEQVSFKTFDLALAFYRGYMANRCQYTGMVRSMAGDDGVCIVNTDRADGAEDSRCKDGLTEDERNAVEEVG